VTPVGRSPGLSAAPSHARDATQVDAITEVRLGRGTTILQKSAKAVDESLLFSLIAKERTVDLQAKSEAERDALVAGFHALISQRERPAPIVEQQQRSLMASVLRAPSESASASEPRSAEAAPDVRVGRRRGGAGPPGRRGGSQIAGSG